jgi:hypothetical protein
MTDQKQEKQRTLLQNKSLHKYFELVAERLNEAGLEKKVVLQKVADCPWTKESVKEDLWRPLQFAQLLKKSTTEMTTKDIDVVYDTLNRFLGEMGIHEPWPSLDDQNFVDTYKIK